MADVPACRRWSLATIALAMSDLEGILSGALGWSLRRSPRAWGRGFVAGLAVLAKLSRTLGLMTVGTWDAARGQLSQDLRVRRKWLVFPGVRIRDCRWRSGAFVVAQPRSLLAPPGAAAGAENARIVGRKPLGARAARCVGTAESEITPRTGWEIPRGGP